MESIERQIVLLYIEDIIPKERINIMITDDEDTATWFKENPNAVTILICLETKRIDDDGITISTPEKVADALRTAIGKTGSNLLCV